MYPLANSGFTKVTLGPLMGNLAGPHLFGSQSLTLWVFQASVLRGYVPHGSQSGTWFKENCFAFIFQIHISGAASFLSTRDYGRFHSVFLAQPS